MKITPNTPITLQQYIGVKNSQGQFKTYTDWKYGGWINVLYNNEILGSPIIKPEEVYGDNIEFSNIAIPKAFNLDATLTNVVANINTPVQDKLVLKLMDEYSTGYEYTLRDYKSAKDWSALFGEWVAAANVVYSDICNWISMEAITDYCLATGQYIILPEMDLQQSGPTNINWVYNEASQVIADSASDIINNRSMYGLGEPQDRVRIYLGAKQYNKLVRGVNYISASNMSLEAYKSGQFTEFMGFPTARTHYLARNCMVATDPVNGVRDFKNANFLGLIYSIETLCFYSHRYDDPQWQSPTEWGKYYWVLGWRANAGIRNGRGQLNTLIVKTAPTLTDVQNALARLNKQVGFYPQLPSTISQDTLTAWNTANDRSFYKPAANEAAREARATNRN